MQTSLLQEVVDKLILRNLLISILIHLPQQLLYLMTIRSLNYRSQLISLNILGLVRIEVVKSFLQGTLGPQFLLRGHSGCEFIEVDRVGVILVEFSKDKIYFFSVEVTLAMRLVCFNQFLSLYEPIVVFIDLLETLTDIFPLLLRYLREGKIALQHRNEVVLPLNV